MGRSPISAFKVGPRKATRLDCAARKYY